MRPGTAEAQIGADELAEGLMLIRASTLKVIRLHLAMERQDRKVVLAAVDDLVALDRRLEEFLVTVPEVDDPSLKEDMEADRSALNIEKLTLAAGISSGHPSPPASFDEPRLVACEEPAESIVTPEPVPEEWDWPDEAIVELEKRRARVWPWLAIAVLFAALAIASYLLGAVGSKRILTSVTESVT